MDQNKWLEILLWSSREREEKGIPSVRPRAETQGDRFVDQNGGLQKGKARHLTPNWAS